MTRTFAHPVSILMPICNEVAVVRQVVEEWANEVFQYLPSGSEMLFDDGASTDGTLETLDTLREKYPFIRVLRSRKEGFAAAARRLYDNARCDYVFFTDSDGQYVAAEFWKVVEALDGYDIAHGAKQNRQDPKLRLVASAVFNRITTLLYGVKIPDINSAFRLQRKSIVEQILPQTHCMPTLLNAELMLRSVHAGYTVKSVKVAHRAREHGESRGLPPATFFKECRRAYRGLLQLRRELRQDPQQSAVNSKFAAAGGAGRST